MRLVLVDIRSASNVGNMLRSAAAFGVEQVDLIGLTPTPEHPLVQKTALDGLKMAWQFWPSWTAWRQVLPTATTVVALETGGANLAQAPLPAEPYAIVVGTERTGLPASVLRDCSQILSIPQVETGPQSLNVANAAAIALFWALARA